MLGKIEPVNKILQRREVGYRQAMPVIKAVRENVKAMRTDDSFAKLFKTTEDKLSSIQHVPSRPQRIRRRALHLNDSVVESTLGQRVEESETEFKRISLEIIDKVILELDERFERNNSILNAAECATDLLEFDFDFDYNNLQP